MMKFKINQTGRYCHGYAKRLREASKPNVVFDAVGHLIGPVIKVGPKRLKIV